MTCIKCVSLKSEGTLSGLKQYVAVSTSYCYNEDVTSRGRMSEKGKGEGLVPIPFRDVHLSLYPRTMVTVHTICFSIKIFTIFCIVFLYIKAKHFVVLY